MVDGKSPKNEMNKWDIERVTEHETEIGKKMYCNIHKRIYEKAFCNKKQYNTFNYNTIAMAHFSK